MIDRWPKPAIAQFADDVGLPYVTAQVMRYRNSISPCHWPEVVAAAQRRGFTDITHELLSELYAAQSSRRRAMRKRLGNAQRPPSEAVAAV